MLYVVEIRRNHEHLAKVMSAIREWLDGRRFEPNAFASTQTNRASHSGLSSNKRARLSPALKPSKAR